MGKVLNKANGSLQTLLELPLTEVTTFTEVTNFSDFLEAFLNKYFRFTHHIAQAQPNVTQVRIGRVTYNYIVIGNITLGLG